MPLTSTDKAIPRPGESRKIGARSASSSRESSQPPRGAGTSVPKPIPQRSSNDDVLSRSRRPSSIDRANPLHTKLADKLAPLRFKTSTRPGADSKEQSENNAPPSRTTEDVDDTISTSLTFNETGWEGESDDEDLDGDPTTVFRRDWRAGPSGGGGAGHRSLANDGDSRIDHSLDGFSDPEDAYEEDPVQKLSSETPSRTGLVAPAPIKTGTRRRVDFLLRKESLPGNVDEVQPERQGHQQVSNASSSLARHAEHRQEVRTSSSSAQQPSKVAASSDEGTGDGDNPLQNATSTATTKRTYEEIDYDADELSRKSYADLDAVPFLTDPRASTSAAASTPTRPQQSLNDQLSNLSYLSVADQKRLFQSLTEAEHEQTGIWFSTWFGESVKNLQHQRLHRRKVALKYEMEARKRQRVVEAKMAECQEQLTDMKQAGSKLVEGRSVEKLGMGMSTAATPRREAQFR